MQPKLKQITTGEYQYLKRHRINNSNELMIDGNGNPVKMTGHCIYGLGEDGQVYKFIPKNNLGQERIWIKLEDSKPDYGY